MEGLEKRASSASAFRHRSRSALHKRPKDTSTAALTMRLKDTSTAAHPPGKLITEVTTTTTTTVVETVIHTYVTPAVTPSASPTKRSIPLPTPPSSPITAKAISIHSDSSLPPTVTLISAPPSTKRISAPKKPSVSQTPRKPRDINPPVHWVPHPEYLQMWEEGDEFEDNYLVLVGQSCGLFFTWYVRFF